jgi:hypothetical protein
MIVSKGCFVTSVIVFQKSSAPALPYANFFTYARMPSRNGVSPTNPSTIRSTAAVLSYEMASKISLISSGVSTVTRMGCVDSSASAVNAFDVLSA